MYFVAYYMLRTHKISPVFLVAWYKNYLGNKRIITERWVIDTEYDCKTCRVRKRASFCGKDVFRVRLHSAQHTRHADHIMQP